MKKNTAYFKPENTKFRLKVETLVRKKYPSISEKELNSTIEDLKRLIKVFYRITREPQYKSYYQETEINGKRIRRKVSETTISELKKAAIGKPNMELVDMFRELERVKRRDEK